MLAAFAIRQVDFKLLDFNVTVRIFSVLSCTTSILLLLFFLALQPQLLFVSVLTDYLVARLNVDCYQCLRETREKKNETKSLTLSAVISEMFLSSRRKTAVR